MDEELRSHIQLRADDLERFGLSRPEAERRARIEFGGEARFKEESREAIYGMPFDEWKAKYQKESTPEQKAAFEKASHRH